MGIINTYIKPQAQHRYMHHETPPSYISIPTINQSVLSVFALNIFLPFEQKTDFMNECSYILPFIWSFLRIYCIIDEGEIIIPSLPSIRAVNDGLISFWRVSRTCCQDNGVVRATRDRYGTFRGIGLVQSIFTWTIKSSSIGSFLTSGACNFQNVFVTTIYKALKIFIKMPYTDLHSVDLFNNVSVFFIISHITMLLIVL